MCLSFYFECIQVFLCSDFLCDLVTESASGWSESVIAGLVAVGMIGVQISVSYERNNWFFILIIDVIQSFDLLVHSTSVFAYLPDLSSDEGVIPH